MMLLYTSHLYERMIDREIGWPTIEAVSRSGEVVKEDHNGVRRLELFGFVAVMDGNKIVTVYAKRSIVQKVQEQPKEVVAKELKRSRRNERRVKGRTTNYYLGMVYR